MDTDFKKQRQKKAENQADKNDSTKSSRDY